MNEQGLKMVSDKEIIFRKGANLICMEIVGMPEFGMDDVCRHIIEYKRMGFGDGHKGDLLIIANGNVIMSKEAREFSSTQTKKYFNRIAVVGHALTVRFLVNFLNRFYKFDVEMRLFSKEEEALRWLGN